MNLQINKMKTEDWTAVEKIYKQGIEIEIATFQTHTPTYENWDKSHLDICRCVVKCDDIVAGFAVLSSVSSRCTYNGVAEISIYISNEYKGIGIGTKLLNHIVSMSESHGIWTLQSGIIRDNRASIALHEKCGFRKVGYREKIAKNKNGEWKDIIIMERRSLLF